MRTAIVMIALATTNALLHGTPSLVATRRAAVRLCADDDFLLAAAAERARFETDEEALLAVGTCWALLFNAGSGNEGIYSRRLPARRGDSGGAVGGLDIVVTFEDQEDAERYAAQLSSIDFPSATPSEVETESLLAFCAEGGHTLGLVRRGTLVTPPDESVERFEWSPGASEEADAPLEGSAEELEAARGALEAMLGIEPEAKEEEDDDNE